MSARARKGAWLAIGLTLLASAPARAIDIAEHGACSGASDDSRAIQEAILVAQNHAVDHSVTFSCLAPVTEVVVVGTGKPAITLQAKQAGDGILVVYPPPSGNALTLDDCDGCIVQDLTFLGSPAPGTPAKKAVLLMVQRSRGVTVTRNTFQRAGGGALAALRGLGNSDNVYSFNTISSTETPYTRGMWIGNAPTCAGHYEFRPRITDNTVTNTGHSGIAIFADGAEARRNTVRGAAVSGILFAASPLAVSRNGIADGNVVIENGAHGIQSDSMPGSRTESITVTHNVCSRNNDSGIYAVNANGWVIRDNTCEDNNQDRAGTGNGITVHASHGTTIENNTLRNTTPARTQSNGIAVVGVDHGTAPDVSCLTIRRNTASDHLYSGIAVSNAPATPRQSVDSIVLEENITHDNGRWGIDVALATTCGVSNVTLAGNSASGNGTGEIRDQTTADCGAGTCGVRPPPGPACAESP